MSIDWVARGQPALTRLFERFRTLLPHYVPEAATAHLFGGIPLGGFSPPWSDIDVIAWVDAPEVTQETQERACALWEALAREPLGELLYLYVAPRAAMGGPYTAEGGGAPGGPRSVRIYRSKSKPMEGYPLSLPDTVSLVRYGVPLLGAPPDPAALPAIPVDWPVAFLRAWLPGLLRTVEAGTGPYGTGPLAQMIAWGPDGTMAQPLWFARHLYSLATGEMLAKEHAVSWYLGRRPVGALADALWLVQGWRQRGEAPDAELAAVARMVRPALLEFLAEALPLAGISDVTIPNDPVDALRTAIARS